MHFHSSRERGSYRAWLHYGGGSAGCAHLELSWGNWLCGISFGFDDEAGWGGSLYLPPIGISLRANVPRWLQLKPNKNDRHQSWDASREISLRVHGGAIWWTLWRSSMAGWSRDVPRWRDGNFNLVDFLLGRAKCTTRTLEERDVLVPMPEKAYPAKAQMVEYTWKRPRWFAKRAKRVQIDVPGGIPFPGKGESEWNCGDDATFGITTGPCRSIAEGVGTLVGSCLHDRVKNGGWSDWTWSRGTEAPPQPAE